MSTLSKLTDYGDDKKSNENRGHREIVLEVKSDFIGAVDNLKKITGIDNKTEIVVSCVGIVQWLIKKSMEGSRIIVKNQDGTTQELFPFGKQF